ncbi:MAG: ATP-binding cassette domain-containing protein [Alphaproteobacteria bacterium]|nr:ATP-binding cassette domain-containing protein [Alphaproteobacteria bacterium]
MIILDRIELRRGARVLLSDASVTLHTGEKIGLVGRNGAGKSSLFSLLAGRLHEDRGTLSVPAQWQRAEVEQHMPETDRGATDFVLAGDERLNHARAALAQAEAERDGEAIALAHAALQDAGAFDAQSRAQSLILGLGFATDALNRPVNSFSGGWRMRLQLARALMRPSDLLLLDEPTNHLDLDALVWLESWLQRYPGTLIVISHDREFLDAVTRVTLAIDGGHLTRYNGGYSAYEMWLAEQQTLQQAAFEKQQEKIAHLQKFIDRFKAKATKAKQAQSRVKALDRMEKLAPVLAQAEFQFEFRTPEAMPNPMLNLRQSQVGYRSPEGQIIPILDAVQLSVLPGQRIGILGANGQGKSTLVKTLVGQLAPLSGQRTEGKGLAVGYFAQQELDVLSLGDTPLEHMVRLARHVSPQAREQELRNFLGSFRFPDELARQTVGTLSGGERARLVLAMLVWQKPNLLLLDEPTNHLDLATREALAMALNSFEGSLLLVSHDRALLRSVCDEFWLVSRGRVTPFDGDLEDYQQHVLEEARLVRDALRQRSAPQTALNSETSPKLQRQQAAQKRQALAEQTRPWRKELERIDTQLPTLNQERETLLALAATPEQITDMADWGRRCKALEDQIHALEERWLELSEMIETVAII